MQKVTNNTPYTWYWSEKRNEGFKRLGKAETADVRLTDWFFVAVPIYGLVRTVLNDGIFLRYGDHSQCDLTGFCGVSSYIIRESSDRRNFELVEESSRKVLDRCPNYGRIEEEKQRRAEEERQRRAEEERRRRAEEERRRRAEEERRRRAEEERRRRAEEERQRRAEEERQRAEEERRRRAEEKRQRAEEERRRRAEEERRRRAEEERRRRAEEERRRRAEEERWRRAEEERQRRAEEERRRRAEEERQRRAEEERRRRAEEERRRRAEEERRRRAEEERRRRDEEERQRRAEEERRRRDEEERRQKELEKIMRIQEQINKENEASEQNISEGLERLLEQQRLKATTHQEHIQVLHQILETPAAHIKRDELADVGGKFEELLSEYEITGNENSTNKLEDQLKTLQNELTLNYLQEYDIPVESLRTLDQVTGYVDLSLTERFSVLEAVVKVTLDGDTDFEDLTTEQDKMTQFLLNLQDQLHVSNPTLARRVLVNILQTTSKLSRAGKESLGLILFNNIWTPTEIKFFIGRTSSMDQKEVTQILHKVCTYRLSWDLVLSALHDYDPVSYIDQHVSCEVDKDIYAILDEMQNRNYPEHVLSKLGYILQDVAEVLSRCENVEITDEMIHYCKRLIRSLDFSDFYPYCETLKEILILLSIAVKKCTTFTTTNGKVVPGYFPRLTQLASLLLLLLPQEQEKRGCLLEIGTGEGKTCILAMFATIQAVRGTAVDIVTSSPVLAIRDQEEWQKLYSMFGVTSSTVPPPHHKSSSAGNQDKLLEDAYRKQVVYSTVSTFAGDILRQEFEKTRTRGARKFECVVVDEVDYMTLDSGVQVTFLSHQANGLRHAEQVLASIWAMVSSCRPIEMFTTGEIQWTTRIQCFHKAAKQSVIGSESEDISEDDILLLGAEMGFYSQQDIEEFNNVMTQVEDGGNEDEKWKTIDRIMAKVGPKEQYELVCKLNADNSVVIDCYSVFNNKAQVYGKENPHSEPDVRLLLLQNGRACEIMSEKELIDTTVDTLKHRIRYSSECTLDSPKESEGFIVIPSFLEKYIENQLPVFVENALRAIMMTPGREYMIDRTPEADRATSSSTDQHQYDAIIPVDFQASGVLEKNKRWGSGLQQFLEMKHQLAISQLSNVTNYMSNVHFFKRYLGGKGIFGVSGTLGGEAEKAFLERQYNTAIYVIPAHRRKKLVELPAVQVRGGNAEWIQVICETAWRAADSGQVVLVICEDVNTADDLKSEMCDQERRSSHITMYTISEKHNIEKQNFSQGDIIIATNLGGRGTDIHVQQEVNDCGGLLVLLTYFPGSQRVEKQAFGRTARKGNTGMVQMILCWNQLAAAYQGHSVETMRQLREENEVRCLESMERNELLEIETKEHLFSSFCEFLSDFDKNYTKEEKTDITQKVFKNIPDCFKRYQKKFDYQTALSALKDSWAFWLILHEQHINRHDDISTLRADLSKHLEESAEGLLQGRSNSFYDYTELAKTRTDMHRIKKKSDHGALRYWKRAEECDPFYSAVALYNQAYITINLRNNNYIPEAKRLLEKCMTAVDVYLSETTNTLMFCNLSVTKDFTPHHISNRNLQSQMTTRMNIFNSWKGYIENSLKSLEQIKGSKGEAITEDSSVYRLSTDNDFITTKELITLDEVGLCIVFEVKKKPEFSIDALLCFCLGVLQVAAGVLICALSYGTASQFGLGLISEGVSDMIDGVKGMIQGGFNWAQWAISKAISIGVSLVFGGLSKLRKVASAIKGGAKGLITGAKSSSVITLKQCFKQAGKFVVQEVVKQGCINVLNYAADKALRALFENVLMTFFNKKVYSMMRNNSSLDKVLTDYICSGVSKTAVEQGFTDMKIEGHNKEQMRKTVRAITTEVIPSLTMECTKFCQVQNVLSELCGTVIQHIENKGTKKELQIVIKTLEMSKYVKLLIHSFPTEFVINQNFVPQLLQALNELPQVKDQDERHQLPDVKHLKDEFMNMIAESVSHSFVETCLELLTSLTNRMCMRKINSVAGSAVTNLLGRTDTQSFFDNQVYKHQVKKAIQHPPVTTSEADEMELDHYIKKIGDVNRPATALDIHVLTESDALQGRGIRVITVDKHGKKLTEDYYQGKDSSADDIVFQLKKDPEHSHQTKGFFARMKDKMTGKQTAYSGHFEIVNKDGSVSSVHSEGQNCFYHAVVQATSKNPSDHEHKAAELRNVVRNSLQQNKPRYAEVLKLQRGHEEAFKSPGKYTIIGGGIKTRKKATENYEKLLSRNEMPSLSEKDADAIKKHRLGLVGKRDDVRDLRKETKSKDGNNDNNSPVEADHIPPMNTIQQMHEELKSQDRLQQFQEEHKGLSRIIHESGNKGLCMEARKEDHRKALTTGNSHESRAIRKELADVGLSGDVSKFIKLSLLAANPVASEDLRGNTRMSQNSRSGNIEDRNNIGMDKSGIKHYYRVGSKGLVDEYCRMGVIDDQQRRDLRSWISNSLFSKNTPEYHHLQGVMERGNNNAKKNERF